MNKQELIEKLQSQKGKGHFENDYVAGINMGLQKAIIIISELEEPERPVLPKWVDDSFKMHKNRSIRKVIRNVMADTRRGELYQTVCPNDIRLEKIIALAFITGEYEVKPESKTYRFELQVYHEIDVTADTFEEAKKQAEKDWQDEFANQVNHGGAFYRGVVGEWGELTEGDEEE